jgi:HEAT repeat protein
MKAFSARSSGILTLIMVAAFLGCSLPVQRLLAQETKPEPLNLLTEREYLVEELKLVEDQLKTEQTLFAAGKSTADKVFNLKRSTISLKRQISAYDLNHPNVKTASERDAQREKSRLASEERKGQQEDQEKRALALKKELFPHLREIAMTDKDPNVRQTAVGSLRQLPFDEVMEVLAKIAREDKETMVRTVAIEGLASFRRPASTELLVKIYEQLEDARLKTRVLGLLREDRSRTNEYRQVSVENFVPASVLPLLIRAAKDDTSLEVRHQATQQISAMAGEEATTTLVSLYEATNDRNLRQNILSYLGNRGDRPAMQKLLEIAQKDNDPTARAMAVQRLGNLPFGRNANPSPPGFMPPVNFPVPPFR